MSNLDEMIEVEEELQEVDAQLKSFEVVEEMGLALSDEDAQLKQALESEAIELQEQLDRLS